MSFGVQLRYALGEARGAGGRLALFVLCLAVGVAAVVSVTGLASSLERSVRAESRSLLAADLSVSGRWEMPPELDALLAAEPDVAFTPVHELVTLAASDAAADGRPGRSQLVALKAVGEGYPFYGELVTTPADALGRALTGDGAVVAPELLPALGVAVGDAVHIGRARFEILGVVDEEPDRVSMSLGLAPRLFLGNAGLRRTGLLEETSRVSYKRLVALDGPLDETRLAALEERVTTALDGETRYSVESASEAQPDLRRGIRRVQRFAGLVALLSLIAGGLGVAQAIRAWLASRLDAIAVLRCLGLTPRGVALIYLVQTAMIGLSGALLGAAAGLAIHRALPLLFGELIRADLLGPWPWGAALRGIVLGTGIALLFSLAPISAALRVSPVRVFRQEAEPLPSSPAARVAISTVTLTGVLALAASVSGSWPLAALFTATLLAAAALLGGLGLALTRLLSSARRGGGGVALRYGLAAGGRPGAATLGAVVTLGLGVTVVLALYLIEQRVSAQLDQEVPANAPSLFFVDVQQDQWEPFRAELAAAGAEGVDAVPMVVARLSALGGTPVDDLVAELTDEQDGRRWALTREQRLTYLEELPEDNEIVEGALWSDPERHEVSIEVEFARDLGVGVGDTLVLDVQGVPLELAVTSLRRVDWGSFGINFFIVGEPAAFDGAPAVRVATARVAPSAEQALQDRLIARFPNVTVLRVRRVLETVRRVLGRLGLGVRLLGLFAVVAGLAILGGAATASAVHRRREVALFKTLGMSRLEIVFAFATEHALAGLAGGAAGALAAAPLAWVVVTRLLEVPWAFHVAPYLVAVAGVALLSSVAGLVASAGALVAPPVASLRGE